MRVVPGPAASASPQQHAFSKAYGDVRAHVDLDEAFCRVKGALESHLGLLQKQTQVRVRNWIKKLSEETANVTWKKNRNAYARLLLDQLRCGRLAEPFSGQPPGGPLPTLPKHLVYAFKAAPAASGRSGASGFLGGCPAGATAPQDRTALAAPRAEQEPRLRPSPGHHQVQLSATEQLDEYLGRATFRRAQFAQEAEEEGEAVAAAFVPRSAVAPSAGAGPCLPGTRMQLRGAEGRRVDRHQLADVGWQPSKLELEAQLGASRERQAELEWRLGAMEGLLRQHAALLQPGGAAPGPRPLGSLLDAIDDGHVSPPRQRAGKQELDELIERYEAKRLQWRSPGRPTAGGAGSPGRRRAPPQPAVLPSDEAEMLEQLDNFQRQTETIRRALGGGGDGGDGPTSSGGWGEGGEPRQLASSLAAAASEWGVADGTPLRQHPTGLRGSGYTPAVPQQAVSLFDGLPPSPAALAATRGHANRHVQHAGHFAHGSSAPQQQPQQQQQQGVAQPPVTRQASSRRGGPALTAAEQQRPRSPIGPDIKHTKKSAAAAEKASGGAAAALQRLKSRRPGSAGAAHAAAAEPAAPSPPAASPLALQQQQQPAGRALQHQEASGSWQQRTASDEDSGAAPSEPSAAAAPEAARLPPDSNAALVAEVRQLRARLQESLQKHAPELVAAGVSLSSLGGGSAQKWQHRDEQRSDSPSSSWRLSAAPAATEPPPPASVRSAIRPTDQPSYGAAWSAAPASAASANRFRLTDDSSSAGLARLGSLGGSSLELGGLGGGLGGSSFGGAAAATPGTLLSRGGSMDLGGGGGGRGSSFSLEAFEAQTEALRRQLAAL